MATSVVGLSPSASSFSDSSGGDMEVQGGWWQDPAAPFCSKIPLARLAPLSVKVPSLLLPFSRKRSRCRQNLAGLSKNRILFCSNMTSLHRSRTGFPAGLYQVARNRSRSSAKPAAFYQFSSLSAENWSDSERPCTRFHPYRTSFQETCPISQQRGPLLREVVPVPAEPGPVSAEPGPGSAEPGPVLVEIGSIESCGRGALTY